MKTKYSKCIEFLLTMINFIAIYYTSPSLCSTPIAISQSWGVEGCLLIKNQRVQPKTTICSIVYHQSVTHHISVLALWGLSLLEISRKLFPGSLSNLVLPHCLWYPNVLKLRERLVNGFGSRCYYILVFSRAQDKLCTSSCFEKQNSPSQIIVKC